MNEILDDNWKPIGAIGEKIVKELERKRREQFEDERERQQSRKKYEAA